tara:strand:+ start:185 stop:499 length:315 start_codon:yes stop_codon:yes gene_type:complete
MSYRYQLKKKCLIVFLTKNYDNLSFIKELFNKNCKHLILDLTEVSELNIKHLTKFTKFGKNLVQHNSFVMISNQFLQQNFLIVPTLKEAFDIIEMEDIERSLNI